MSFTRDFLVVRGGIRSARKFALNKQWFMSEREGNDFLQRVGKLGVITLHSADGWSDFTTAASTPTSHPRPAGFPQPCSAKSYSVYFCSALKSNHIRRIVPNSLPNVCISFMFLWHKEQSPYLALFSSAPICFVHMSRFLTFANQLSHLIPYFFI